MKNSNTIRIIILHLLGIIAYLSLPIIFSPDVTSGIGLFKVRPFLHSFFRQLLLVVFFYGNYYYLIPKLYYKNSKYKYAGIILLLAVVVVLFPYLVFPLENNFDHLPPHKVGTHKVTLFFKMSPEGGIIQYGFILITSFLLKLSQFNKQIEKEKQEAEISFLRTQINPHFLFNSLNTIYALALTRDTKTADAVVNLSSIMRYIMSQSNKDKIKLEQEIHYIDNYIKLQKKRFGETALIEYTKRGDFQGQMISPLMLIPFIENAFEYGINPNEYSRVLIIIEIVDTTLLMMIKNSIVRNGINGNKIGLNNTKRRLNLIYPDKHKLEIQNSGVEYSINLTIELL